MKDKNWHQVIGEVTEKPTIGTTNAGHQVINFDVKVTDYFYDKAGIRVEKPSFHRIVSFKPQVINFVINNVRAGERVLIEGRSLSYPKVSKEGHKTSIQQILIGDDSVIEIIKQTCEKNKEKSEIWEERH